MDGRVRCATDGDCHWILGGLQKFSDFVGGKYALFGDWVQARAGLRQMISKDVAYVYETEQGERIGFIIGILFRHMFNPKITVLAELFWWVDPEHRGGPAGGRLMDTFIRCGKERAQHITFSLQHNTQINEESLSKLGFRLQERSYLMEV